MFQRIPKVENEADDVMATLFSLIQLEKHESRFEFLVEELHYPIFDSQESHVICTLGCDSSHYGLIYSYLHDGIKPKTFNQSKHRKLIWNVSHHSLISSDLYRRGLDGTLLRCLENEESDQALVDIHEGIYGGQSNGLAMAQRLLRVGYYWPMMHIDVEDFAKSCEKCQKHDNLIHDLGRKFIPSISH